MATTKELSKIAKVTSAAGLCLVALNGSGQLVRIAPDDIHNGLPAGGRNLIVGSNVKASHYSSSLLAREEEKFEGMTVYRKDNRWGDTGVLTRVLAGETYTFSVFVKGNPGDDPKLQVKFTTRSDQQDGCCASLGKSLAGMVNNDSFTRVSITFTAEKDCYACGIAATFAANPDPLYFCGEKLERGIFASDWTPAPEDLASNSVGGGGKTLIVCKLHEEGRWVA